MNWYLFSFVINPNNPEPTDPETVYKALCGLRAQGFGIHEVSLTTTFLLSHSETKFGELNDFAKSVLADQDQLLLCRVAKQPSGEPYMTGRGQDFDCTQWED